jgi:hypothetical protein
MIPANSEGDSPEKSRFRCSIIPSTGLFNPFRSEHRFCYRIHFHLVNAAVGALWARRGSGSKISTAPTLIAPIPFPNDRPRNTFHKEQH